MSNQTPQYSQPPYQPQPAKKPRWFARHKILTGIGVLFLIGIIFGGVNGGSSTETASTSTDSGSSSSADTSGSDTTAADEPTTEPTTEQAPAKKAPAKKTSAMSAGQENALQKAKAYLDMSGFSRTGLTKQLKFDGFSTADASFAADAVHADWNKQAARKAKDYLDMSGFSRSGLITQLKFDGFTQSQAEYGASQNGLRSGLWSSQRGPVREPCGPGLAVCSPPTSAAPVGSRFSAAGAAAGCILPLTPAWRRLCVPRAPYPGQNPYPRRLQARGPGGRAAVVAVHG
jgi:hypothetical protein